MNFEEAVGITEYASNCMGINGILKQRFSDFVVREVSKDGVIAALKSLDGSYLDEIFRDEEDSGIASNEEIISRITEALEKIQCFPANSEEFQVFLRGLHRITFQLES